MAPAGDVIQYHLIHFIWSTLVKLQTDWIKDQVTHMWDLILAPVSLSPTLGFLKYIFKMAFFKIVQIIFFKDTMLYSSIQWV